MAWKSSSHAIYDCRYHLVWAPKRRKRINDEEIRRFIHDTIYKIAEEFEFEIEALKVAEDHLHLLIGFPTKYSISKVAGIIKSISTSRTFERYAWLRKKYWSQELWEDGYAARTVGDKVTTEWVKKYIRRHEREATNQLDLF